MFFLLFLEFIDVLFCIKDVNIWGDVYLWRGVWLLIFFVFILVLVFSKRLIKFEFLKWDVICNGVFFFWFVVLMIVFCWIRKVVVNECLLRIDMCNGVFFLLLGRFKFVLFIIKFFNIFWLNRVVWKIGVWNKLFCLLICVLFFIKMFIVVMLLFFVVKCKGVFLFELCIFVLVLCERRVFIIFNCWFFIVLCRGEIFCRLYWLILMLIIFVSKMFVMLVFLYFV